MTALLPQGLKDTDDVAVDHVVDGVTVHRPGDVATPCGVPMWSVQHPLPSAGHVLHLRPTFCAGCFPRDNPWTQMLAAAYDTSRFAARFLNTSSGLPLNHGRSGR